MLKIYNVNIHIYYIVISKKCKENKLSFSVNYFQNKEDSCIWPAMKNIEYFKKE